MMPLLVAPPGFRDTLPLRRFVQTMRESSIATFLEEAFERDYLERQSTEASPTGRRLQRYQRWLNNLESGQASSLFLRNGAALAHRRWLLQNKSALFLELCLVDLALGETLLQNRHGA
jgi:hypothetical protein